MNDKVMSNSTLQDLFNEITQFDVELMTDDYSGNNREVYYDDVYNDFWFADDWDDDIIEARLNETLPPKKKLIKLFLENPQFKESCEMLAENIVDSFIGAFESRRETYCNEKESDEQILKEEAECNSAKNKLAQSLSNEQREALRKVYSISL